MFTAAHDPVFPSPYPPVKGLFDAITSLPLLGNPMPVSGPVAKISLFSGENGSVPCFKVSQRILIAKPLPPKKFKAKSSWYGSGLASLLVKLIFRKNPVHPCTIIHQN